MFSPNLLLALCCCCDDVEGERKMEREGIMIVIDGHFKFRVSFLLYG
jgi:hypothetical protein